MSWLSRAIGKDRKNERQAAKDEANPTSDVNSSRRWAESQERTGQREGQSFADYLSRGASSERRIDAVANADVSRLDSFDPTEAIKQYATSAWSDVSSDLASQLEALQGANAKSGRLNTGYFDSDRGMLITDATRRFQTMLGQQSVAAAGMSLDARGQATDAVNRGNESALAASLDRERMGGDMYNTEADRYRDMVALNWQRNQARRVERKNNRQSDWNTGIAIAGTVAGYLPKKG